METDPAEAMKSDVDDITSGLSADSSASGMAAEFKQWLSSVPGIDEAVALSRVLNLVESGEYNVVIFDTAPHGAHASPAATSNSIEGGSLETAVMES